MTIAHSARMHPLAWVGGDPEHRDWRPEHGCRFPQLEAAVRIEAFVTVDSGIETPTRIGAGTWLMKHVHIGHDADIGEGCELAPGVVVGGHCRIGNRVRVGVNACLRPFVTVGDGARIGAGAVVVTDVPAGEVWAGNPARRLPSPAAKAARVAGPILTRLEEEGWEALAAHEHPDHALGVES